MSAGNAPPNPGSPKTNPHRPNPSMFARYPGRFATGAVLAVAAYFYIARPPAPSDEPLVTLRTPGVQNIEGAYSNAGATPTHTKAYGGTEQGKKDAVALREQGGTGGARLGSPMDKEGMGYDQRAQTQTKVEEAFQATNLGSKKGMPVFPHTLNHLTCMQENEG